MCVFTHVCIYECMHVRMNVCISLHVNVCRPMHACRYMCIYVYVCRNVFMHAYYSMQRESMYVCMHVSFLK